MGALGITELAVTLACAAGIYYLLHRRNGDPREHNTITGRQA